MIGDAGDLVRSDPLGYQRAQHDAEIMTVRLFTDYFLDILGLAPIDWNDLDQLGRPTW